jgi:glycine cleavage system aminomethyltransferase T
MKMKPHLRATLAEIDSDITQLKADLDRLVSTRATLVDLYGGDSAVEAAPRSNEKPAQAVTETEPPKEKRGGRTSAETVALIAVARTMPEPISAVTLSVAGIVEKKFAANSIVRWAANGWLEKIGWGEYKRSKSFPEAA